MIILPIEKMGREWNREMVYKEPLHMGFGCSSIVYLLIPPRLEAQL